MSDIHYLAYGSNLHPVRLKQRVSSSRPIGCVVLGGHHLRFHKKGADDSGKCDAFFTGESAHTVHGAVYSMRADQRHLLDAAEGLGHGYNRRHARLTVAGSEVETFFYAADSEHVEPGLAPFSWYKRLVVEGARIHGLPDEYVHFLDSVPALEDPDTGRARAHLDILDQWP